MDFVAIGEELGTETTSAILGLIVGLVFGIFAQQSRFCLRAACVEFWRGHPGVKFSIWLLSFSAALLATQYLIFTDNLDTSAVRQLANTGSLSGAIIGGLLFGIGMVLARGCASRLLVLSGTGNLRALVSGLIVTVAAQASLRGALSPLREKLGALWLVDAESRNMANYLPEIAGMLAGAILLVLALYFVYKNKTGVWVSFGAVVVGASVALGWFLTNWHASWSFDTVAVQSVSFTGPAADTLMGLINTPKIELSFSVGLVPGVFFGSMLAALLTREFEVQKFTEETGLTRYLIGAVIMGFGGMLAGGCAVGAGVTGGAVLAVTAWVALFFMWLGAGLTDLLIDKPKS
ncbi:MAG: YeeE/YedE family protein [Granulosicoccaceae bacterium]